MKPATGLREHHEGETVLWLHTRSGMEANSPREAGDRNSTHPMTQSAASHAGARVRDQRLRPVRLPAALGTAKSGLSPMPQVRVADVGMMAGNPFRSEWTFR
ncbi:hypothetical protein Ssi02_01770 [Sinosporangium siamense]|uniref:Uncharacterized protein n=1 Tax=Sinosporangium siamense TaxID=1367973 RepID=A0A919R9M3_9ACTN|nr:hypothetical protein Ssi02_01770 [Sinosporangium siamense]